MKIAQLISGVNIPLNNQEKLFVDKYYNVKIDSLSEQDQWLAQNLVRKGVYSISKDNQTLIKHLNEKNS
jgi:hypothetical protein